MTAVTGPASIAPHGRWGGKLTSRPLPEADPELASLAAHDRRDLVTMWLARSASERRVGDAFEIVEQALREVHAVPAVIALAHRAIDDEVRHAEICRVVASRIAGAELPAPPRLPLVVPEHPGASPALRATLHVFGHTSLNETTAGAFLETCLEHAAEGTLAKAALRELLSDEIDHGRIGWAHLATLSPAARDRLGPWLLPLVRNNLRIWRETARVQGRQALSRHGAPPAEVLDAALLGAIRDLIVPGLAHLGLPTSRLEVWLDAGASTARLSPP